MGDPREDMTDQNAVAERLKSAQEECDRLRAENARLRAMLGIQDSVSKEPGPTAIRIVSVSDSNIAAPSTPEKKISLFRSLFRGREDVYAIRWEGKGGKSGYSPAGVMDWRAIHAASPEERKKVARKTRTLQPLTDSVIRDHLTGKQTIGVYPLLPDETCWFLAVDFDKKSWMADAAAFASTCQRWQVPVTVERSRSGNGAHIWLFFDRPVLAANARQLGCALFTRTMENRHEIGLHLSCPEEGRDEVPWLWSPSRKRKDGRVAGPLPSTVRVVVGNLVYIEKKDLPSAMLDRLIRIAAFQNPEFYRAQAMRLSTYGKPRVI